MIDCSVKWDRVKNMVSSLSTVPVRPRSDFFKQKHAGDVYQHQSDNKPKFHSWRTGVWLVVECFDVSKGRQLEICDAKIAYFMAYLLFPLATLARHPTIYATT
jgi:hypothetical protein